MPISTFSRRKSRRQDSSDIEDEAPSNRVVGGDRNGQQTRRRALQVTGGGDDEDDDEGRIDIENFSDQPLEKIDAPKLQGIGRDWITMEQRVRQHWKVVGDVAVSIADAAEGEDAEKVGTQILLARVGFSLTENRIWLNSTKS